MLLQILIKRLRVLPVEKATVNKKKKITFLAELASLGYRVTNPSLYTDGILKDHTTIINTLKEMKGGDVNYVPLFTGFPNEVPEENEYFSKRIMAYVGNIIGLPIEGKTLDNGITVPEWMFDLKEFGADPITQFQDKTLFEAGLDNQQKRNEDTHIEWTDIKLVDVNEVNTLIMNYLQKLLYANSSIKEALKEEITYLINTFGTDFIDSKEVTFKETAAFLMKYYWEKNDFTALAGFLKNATDILRMFAALTDTDTSLSSPIKFPKLTRTQRKFILSRLDSFHHVEEDLVKHKGLWLEIGRYLHPGEYAGRFKNIFAAYDALRNGKIETFNSKVEKAIMTLNIENVVELLKTKPGVFARKIHQVLEVAGKKRDFVLTHFETIATKIELKNLFVLEAYFNTIENSNFRTVINKKGKIKVLENTPNRLKPKTVKSLLAILNGAILEKITANKETWEGKKAWIDESLIDYTIPLQQRKASDGLLTLGRGSKIPLTTGKVLRLFVYWKEAVRRTDLDLSLIQYDKNMNYIGHVSYTNLKTDGIVHSGDITSAPQGAAEFIDIDISHIKTLKETRYIAPQIYRYAGDKFMEMDCHAGWMIRDKVDNTYASFDIKTVQNKFDLNGTGAYAIPIVIDMVQDEITFVDLYVNGMESHNNVEGSFDDISTVTQQMVRMNITRPNVYDLAKANCEGRGAELVEDRWEADVTIGLKDCDYNVSDIGPILSDLI